MFLDGPEASKGGVDNVNLILGGNGMGKTTLLKAIALSVLTPIIRDCGYVSHRLVREGLTRGMTHRTGTQPPDTPKRMKSPEQCHLW